MRSFALLFLVAVAVFPQQYTSQGDLILPKDYREWIFPSSGIGMTYSNDADPSPRFDNVFVNPAAYRAFLTTGAWPDKTVLVMENRASDSHASNRNGRFQTAKAGMEFHVKDASRGGWKYYSFTRDAETGKQIANQTGCDSCHSNAAVDYTFVQFYPTLIDAAQKNGAWREPKE